MGMADLEKMREALQAGMRDPDEFWGALGLDHEDIALMAKLGCYAAKESHGEEISLSLMMGIMQAGAALAMRAPRVIFAESEED